MNNSILIDKNSIIFIKLFDKKPCNWIKYINYKPKKTILYGLITIKKEVKEGFYNIYIYNNRKKFIENIDDIINENEHLNLLLENNKVFQKPYLEIKTKENNYIYKYFNTYNEMLYYVNELNLDKNFILIEDI